MNRIVKIFEWREDRETGEYGWILESAPNAFNVGDGRLVAHDTLEHFHDTTDSWEDELLALGASHFIRGETGYYSGLGRSDPAEHLSADLCRCFESLSHLGRELRTINSCRPINGDDEGLIRAVDLAVKDYRLEMDASPSPVNKRRLLSYLRTGYRRAYRRFRGEQGAAAVLFNSIEKHVNDLHKYRDYGDKLKVSVSVINRSAAVNLKPAHYDEWY